MNKDFYTFGDSADINNADSYITHFALVGKGASTTKWNRLDATMINDCFDVDVIQTCTLGEYVSMWQIYALASILRCPVYSVYPTKGDSNERKYLNHAIFLKNTDKLFPHIPL